MALAFVLGAAPHSPANGLVSESLGEALAAVRTAAERSVRGPEITPDSRFEPEFVWLNESGEPVFIQPPRQAAPAETAEKSLADRHFERDLEAMRLYRPGFEFWHHVFSVPNGRMAFGSATDGRLLATFPLDRSWTRDAVWTDSSLSELLEAEPPEGRMAERRDETAARLTEAVGPVVYNSTRGTFIAEGTERFGSFLDEWGAIFERFGVPADVGLAQALVESGLKGRIRSEAEAIGFCQWLPRNWERLQQQSPNVIEVYNQTTQAAYCAAHLAVLATKYGSLIPALSEHHAGAVNVGRTIFNGDFAGGQDIRERYFLGGDVTLLIRQARMPGYREVAGSYGPRSFRYAEMVFGNLLTIEELRNKTPQEQIFAMRPDRALSFDEVASGTGMSVDEIRRFNPALINRVPAGANLYLPFPVEEFGSDTTFWHRPPTSEYTSVMTEFMHLDERYGPEHWQNGAVFDELRDFVARFRATGTEEGAVMASVITFVLGQLSDGRQNEILTEVRSSQRARQLLDQSVQQMQTLFQPFDEIGSSRAYRNAFLLTSSGFSLR